MTRSEKKLLTRPFSPSCLFFLQQPTWRFWGEEKVEGGAIYTVYLKKVRYHTPSKSITSGLFAITFLSLSLFHIFLLQANDLIFALLVQYKDNNKSIDSGNEGEKPLLSGSRRHCSINWHIYFIRPYTFPKISLIRVLQNLCV